MSIGLRQERDLGDMGRERGPLITRIQLEPLPTKVQELSTTDSRSRPFFLPQCKAAVV